VRESPLGLLVLGFGLGVRHALDVDHLLAVATLVTERAGLRRSSAIGALWGLGHTAALLVVAVAVVGVRAEMPAGLARWLDAAVAAMLIALGARLLWRLARGATLHAHRHAHGAHVHSHPHLHAGHDHPSLADVARATAGAGVSGADGVHHHALRRPGPIGVRPLLVGMAHGLAGSAALMLALLATVPTVRLAIGYVAAFGVGSIAGMCAMSALVGLPLGALAGRFHRAERVVAAAVGASSVALGVALALGD